MKTTEKIFSFFKQDALSLPQQVSDHAIVFVLLDRRHQFHAVRVLLDQPGACVLVVEPRDLGAEWARGADGWKDGGAVATIGTVNNNETVRNTAFST